MYVELTDAFHSVQIRLIDGVVRNTINRTIQVAVNIINLGEKVNEKKKIHSIRNAVCVLIVVSLWLSHIAHISYTRLPHRH